MIKLFQSIANQRRLIDGYSDSFYDTDRPFSPNSGAPLYATTTFIGQVLTLPKCRIKFVHVFGKRVGTLTGNVYLKLYEVTGTPGTDGKPSSTTPLLSDTFGGASVFGTDLTEVYSGFGEPYQHPGGDLAIALNYASPDGSNYLSLGCDASSPSHGGNLFYGRTVSGNFDWYAVSGEDLCFELWGW